MMFEMEVSKSQGALYEDSFSVSKAAFIDKHSNNTPSTQESVSQPNNKMADIGGAGIAEHLQDKGETSIQGDQISIVDRQEVLGWDDRNKLKRDLLNDFESCDQENLKRLKKNNQS
ncbi:unnamed protein product [Cuscuta campestris]|uniref:Uncharacterized protein n=1 Tax=Cuscuta campestris TaxID=132261 RepID=A0A484MIP8_9ASTE|nr:unnamed protein product [Cuscuta campestris]